MREVLVDAIDENVLKALFNDDISIVRVANFYPIDACELISNRILESQLIGKYANAPDISRVGRAYFEKQSGLEASEDYNRNAIEWIGNIRGFVSPLQPPIDRLRLVLDEIWPAGATIATLEGRRAFCGLTRVFSAGARSDLHMDVLAWDMPEGCGDGRLAAQLAANIYTKMPSQGGDLLIWPRSLSRHEYEQFRIPGSYGVSANNLNSSPTRVAPNKGDLILFNSHLVHAVQPGGPEDRISCSCFIGLKAERCPLQLWS